MVLNNSVIAVITSENYQRVGVEGKLIGKLAEWFASNIRGAWEADRAVRINETPDGLIKWALLFRFELPEEAELFKSVWQ